MSSTGIISFGVKCPIIREGDNLTGIVLNSVSKSLSELGFDYEDGDIIGITESVVARSQGNYVTIDDIVQFMEEEGYKKKLVLYFPIMSRNRFSSILRAFARYADEIVMYVSLQSDEVGNPVYGKNMFTGVDMLDYYKKIVASENCKFDLHCFHLLSRWPELSEKATNINCLCHPENFVDISGGWQIREIDKFIDLSNIMNRPVKREDGSMSGFNTEFGLLGSNKANDLKLKLFPEPTTAQTLVDEISKNIWETNGKEVYVVVYGDGCFKSPGRLGRDSIWEFADPVTCPAASKTLVGKRPTEIKLKEFADNKFADLNGVELEEAIKKEIQNHHKSSDLEGSMASQGTTPRNLLDILASTFDLMSGSGDQGCPVVYMKNRFKNYSD